MRNIPISIPLSIPYGQLQNRFKWLFLLLCLFSFFRAKSEPAHRVLSCNIRVALPKDEAKGYGWKQRKRGCLALIEKQKADIVCFQEVLKEANDDIRAKFSQKYCVLGFDGPEMDVRTEGYQNIAKNVIMFARDRYELQAAGVYWLSETPWIGGSISWGSARARHVTWARLRDQKSGKVFRVLNVHLDHISQEARVKQVEFIVQETGQYRDQFPQLLVGDMNAAQDHPEAELLRRAGWKDTYHEVHGPKEIGTTNHEFFDPNSTDKVRPYRIDFIYGKGSVSTKDAFVIRDKIGAIYPSDHYFLAGDILIR